MSWLALFFALELGWMPQGDLVMYNTPVTEYLPVDYTAYTDLDIEAELWGVGFIGGGIKTSVWQLQESGWTFFPHKAVYSFRAGARWNLLEVGFRHYCIHPIMPLFGVLGTYTKALWEGAYDELYLRVSNR